MLWLLLLLTACQPISPEIGVANEGVGLLIDDATGMQIDQRQMHTSLSGLDWSAFTMQQEDFAHMARVLEVQRTNRQANWTNISTKISYQIVPKSIFFSSGRLCRSFKLRVLDVNKSKDAQLSACRLEDASWQILTNSIHK